MGASDVWLHAGRIADGDRYFQYSVVHAPPRGAVRARESANRLQCQQRLKQIGLGWQMHLDAHQHFPTGGWGWNWTGDPDQGYGPQQPGAWAFNILPFVDEAALRNIGARGDVGTAIKVRPIAKRLATRCSRCSIVRSRRPVTLYPSGTTSDRPQ